VNNVSHELKTPLNAVLGFSEVGLATQDIVRAHRFFGLIRDAGNRLLEISGSMLDFAQAEAGKLAIEAAPFDVRETLDTVRIRWQPLIEAKGLSFSFTGAPPSPCPGVGDARRIIQLLALLLDNAVKFTITGAISLHCETAAQTLELVLTDTGIGMVPEQVQQAFNPFHQADGSRTRQFGGLGLGLALAKYLVDRMRGDIKLESTLGSGTTFRIRLPISGN
jgi:signal transduction histidine kinase